MHEYDLILSVTGSLIAALIAGFITHRLGLSPIVGYLLAGMLVGPHTPGFVADEALAEQLAEIGVILLMFGVGLQFHVKELVAVRRVAVPGAIAQSAVATVLGVLLGRTIGWSWPAGFVFGMALAVASTVVLVRVLADNNDLHTPAGHIAVGWLVVEDLFTVLALVLLPALFDPVASGTPIWIALVGTAVKVLALVAFTAVVGGRVIPRVFDYVANTRSRELFTLTVLVVALGIAVGSARIFGVSMALGAFLAGMVVARSEYSLRAAADAVPLRDAFAVLFFVSVGMLLDPTYLMEAPGVIAGALCIVLLGKPVVAMLIVWALRYPFKVALTTAIALAQIGEFSFILSTMGRELGIVSIDAANTLVAVSIVSIVVNPLLYRGIEPAIRWIEGKPGLWKRVNRRSTMANDLNTTRTTSQLSPDHRAIVIGYGPTGRIVTRLLKENGIEPTVVDLNVGAVRTLREGGIDAFYGDATQPHTLAGAGLAKAGSLILSAAAMQNSKQVIQAARGLNPNIRVLARAAFLRDLAVLKKAGADVVYSGEGEVAVALVEHILERLGATAEQVDRERERAHADLLDGS